ncbi:MAG TPA: cobalamin-binding protein [Acidimicrobiales bacterium]|nr:cobalamin-binding protein [Acidimicrobiales bacterium]
MRIVSLLPSTTEILFAIGAGDDVVGVTFECDHPAEARQRTIVSNTALPEGLSPAQIDAAVRERLAAGEELYRLDAGALHALDPDVVVTQDLCAVCAVDVSTVDDALSHLGCRAEVVTIDPGTLDEVLASIEQLGAVTGRGDRAAELVADLRRRLSAVEELVRDLPRPRVAVLEWTDPPFNAGHWVPDMVTAAGATPVLAASGQRSSVITWQDVASAEPDAIVVSPCGFRLDGCIAMARALRQSGKLTTDAPLWAVDADAAFVRPGPRLVDGVEALASIAHPDVMPARPALAVRI